MVVARPLLLRVGHWMRVLLGPLMAARALVRSPPAGREFAVALARLDIPVAVLRVTMALHAEAHHCKSPELAGMRRSLLAVAAERSRLTPIGHSRKALLFPLSFAVAVAPLPLLGRLQAAVGVQLDDC